VKSGYYYLVGIFLKVLLNQLAVKRSGTGAKIYYVTSKPVLKVGIFGFVTFLTKYKSTVTPLFAANGVNVFGL